jgi:hypothetical protein
MRRSLRAALERGLPDFVVADVAGDFFEEGTTLTAVIGSGAVP